MISQVEPGDAIPAVGSVKLGIVRKNLFPGWNRINPHTHASRTTTPKFADATLALADELLWLQTTLSFRS